MNDIGISSHGYGVVDSFSGNFNWLPGVFVDKRFSLKLTSCPFFRGTIELFQWNVFIERNHVHTYSIFVIRHLESFSPGYRAV